MLTCNLPKLVEQIYMGYADFSRVVASDPDFFVLRRFDTLNARVLLTLHDNIAELDLKYSAPALGGDDLPDRARLIQDIGAKVAGV
ncbi:hypothetical protein MKZ38_001232 [Zalerion maritima]|uniref:DUF6594 domain-containing protein n=1 Tax=Zalerion maritima TaxID=339359 RepID=A0AAD5RQL9_9PEZI|nr:hypothetical protein MKZ38_001232 [Zalerion maritima]